MLSYYTLDKIADSVNPALTLLLILAFLRSSKSFATAKERTTYIVGIVLAILLTYVLAHINRWLHLWPEHRLFPSGHMTYALCVIVSMSVLRSWTRVFYGAMAVLLAAYAYLMVYQGYHDWLDIAGAVVMSPPVTLLGHRLAGNRSLRSEAVTA